MKFKIGDKFKINNDGMNSDQACISYDMSKDKIYVISSIYHDNISWLDDVNATHMCSVASFQKYFDLVIENIIDWNKPVISLAGEKFNVLSTSGIGEFPIVGQFENNSNYYSYSVCGRRQDIAYGFEITNAPDELIKVLWSVAKFENDKWKYCGIYDNEEHARGLSGNISVERVEIKHTNK